MTRNLPALPRMFEDESLQNYMYLIYLLLTTDLKTKSFTDFTTTISAAGSMTVSSASISTKRVSIIGGLVYVEFSGTFTLGGTASNYVQFDLPYISTKDAVLNALITDSSQILGVATISSGSSTAKIYRYDGGNWSLGTLRAIKITGNYSTNDLF